MSVPLKLPSLGESVVEGVVARWLVAEGDLVELDQSLCEVSTDKVDAEIPSPSAGRITRILVPRFNSIGNFSSEHIQQRFHQFMDIIEVLIKCGTTDLR